MLAGSTPASAAGSKVVGYCWYHDQNVDIYLSAIIHADSFDKDDWTLEWRRHVVTLGATVHGPNACRAWNGGADGDASAQAAKAVDAAQRYKRIIDVDWVPEDTFGGSKQQTNNRSKSPARDPVAVIKSKNATTVASRPPVPSRYVEVAGPNGPIRLSPEVAARNQAAVDDYRRKMEEHACARAEHERKLALHQQSQAAAAAEQRAYQQQLAMNDAQVAAHAAALAQHAAATRPAAKGVKGWMYCDARGAPGDKRRFYSRVVEVDYIPGQVTIIDVMGRNRPAFKAYVAGTHSIFFATDSLVHCPYSTTSMADAEALMARDKRGDANNGITVTQTGWTPAS